ncbi:Fur family transcriptional regulator [Parabacteroides sp. AM08-6]|uniref:Fur family transcriptional regulator n=1 Tax=Parabacteroides sp. AM08-6 TaxID=2292053 RepID=UPI000F00BB31|nr:Fur family transcriptional regulator [Parabacteroides sp. AM08-6]RHJ86641.1 transcriptional repressor [Parabacteroides sp. AM08-6]
MDGKKYIELQNLFTKYLAEKKLRKTEERFAILECICNFPGHFDMCQLYQKLEDANFHVSRATLYNTLEVLVDGGLIVRHQLPTQSVQYELRSLAETHMHLVCSKCGAIRELKDATLRRDVAGLKVTRFTPEYYALYIYGLCSKCKYRLQRKNGK